MLYFKIRENIIILHDKQFTIKPYQMALLYATKFYYRTDLNICNNGV